jgi:hypothetical protein
MDYNNRYKALVVAGPKVGALQMLSLMLGEKAKGVRLAKWDQVWGALISFETSQGDLIVSIPARHSEIQ